MTIRTKTSVAQFEAFLALPENAGRRFELINGEIAEKTPTQLHAYIIHMLSGFLFVFLRQHPLGWALIEARYRLPGDDNDLIPDLSFVAKGRGPLVRSGAAPYMPDLSVEAQSEGQSERFMLDSAAVFGERDAHGVDHLFHAPDRRGADRHRALAAHRRGHAHRRGSAARFQRPYPRSVPS